MGKGFKLVIGKGEMRILTALSFQKNVDININKKIACFFNFLIYSIFCI